MLIQCSTGRHQRWACSIQMFQMSAFSWLQVPVSGYTLKVQGTTRPFGVMEVTEIPSSARLVQMSGLKSGILYMGTLQAVPKPIQNEDGDETKNGNKKPTSTTKHPSVSVQTDALLSVTPKETTLKIQWKPVDDVREFYRIPMKLQNFHYYSARLRLLHDIHQVLHSGPMDRSGRRTSLQNERHPHRSGAQHGLQNCHSCHQSGTYTDKNEGPPYQDGSSSFMES